MISIEVVGKNVEQAIENGLAELKLTREDVEIKIIDAGGFFRKAKVQLTVDEEVEQRLIKRDKRLKEEEEKEKAASVEAKEETTEEAAEEVATELQGVTLAFEGEPSLGAKAAGEFIKGLMEKQNLSGEITVKDASDNNIEISITGKDASKLIGYRGEALSGIQYLATIVAGKAEEKVNKVFVDICDYKEKREQSLIKLARRMAVKVAKSKHEFKFEPMNAYERRIIHTALQNDSYVTTTSRGEEPRRYVVIELKKEN